MAHGGRVARRILVVDDSGVFRRTARTLLALRGYELLATARDGRAAIEAASRDCPDGVLLDVNLPDRDGFAVARACLTTFVSASAITKYAAASTCGG